VSELSVEIDLYDHELNCGRATHKGDCCVFGVLAALREKTGSNRHLESLRKEIINRFEAVGLICTVIVKVPEDGPEKGAEFTTFDMTITGRCDKAPFDHERQAWEVQQDTLGLSVPGKIMGDGRLTN
jgi:hypothetical protein